MEEKEYLRLEENKQPDLEKIPEPEESPELEDAPLWEGTTIFEKVQPASDEKEYPTLEEKLAQKKAERKKIKKQERLAKKPSPEEKKERRIKAIVFLVVLLTLFCISFVATSYIIINANKLNFNDNTEQANRIGELEKKLQDKDIQIESLNEEIERLKVNTPADSFSAPVVNIIKQETTTQKETKKEKAEESSEVEKNEIEEIEEIITSKEDEESAEPEDSDVISELEGMLE